MKTKDTYRLNGFEKVRLPKLKGHVTVQCSPNATGSEVYIYGLGNTGTYS